MTMQEQFQRPTSQAHLLSPSSPPTRPSSASSFGSIDTLVSSDQPHRHSCHPRRTNSTSTVDTHTGYRGFESQEAYLAALRAFVESKTYYETPAQIQGFYGEKTVQYYLDKPGGVRSRSKGSRGTEGRRRTTIARPELDGVAEEANTLNGEEQASRDVSQMNGPGRRQVQREEQPQQQQQQQADVDEQWKPNRLRRIFSRRATAS